MATVATKLENALKALLKEGKKSALMLSKGEQVFLMVH